ncbi:signal peptidase II [Ectothiorhodospiraceae bacterium 2226]|nr:signal peptidase II [Ectothiorhodospiraceae bacterium 2226]
MGARSHLFVVSGWRWLWLALVVIVLDQATKQVAVALLDPYQPVPVFPGFNFTLMFNTGAAFSFLAAAGGWQRWLFAAIALGVSIFILMWLRRIPRAEVWLPIALVLILGGALGNLWDRIVLGHVVDFIDLYAGDYRWPAFNVADSAISVGAVMLVIDAFRPQRHR